MPKLSYIYVIKSFDTQAWIHADLIIAFETEKEANKYCDLHSNINDVIYTWDKVAVGSMKGPYPKKKKLSPLIKS